MNLSVVYHDTVAYLHDPGHFANGGKASSDEHVAKDGVPKSNSFVINFWKEASISTLNDKRKSKKLHQLLVASGFFRFTISLRKPNFIHPTEIEYASNAYQIPPSHDDFIL